MTTLYGIKNCDTVRKARKWLETHNITYHFHDFRADGLTGEQLQRWCKLAGWETLLNRRGTSWRQLPPQTRDNIDEASALELMRQNPTLIKRPVLERDDGALLIGFSESEFQRTFH